MFAVILSYKVSPEEVDKVTPAHREFLDAYYANGTLVMSGRQASQKGGVIIANVKTRDALDLILSQDPFMTEGVADYTIYEFTPTKFQPVLAEMIQS